MNISVADIKANLSEILHKAASGEDIEITLNGKPYVKIVAAQPVPAALPRVGAFEGQFTLPDDWDDIPTGMESTADEQQRISAGQSHPYLVAVSEGKTLGGTETALEGRAETWVSVATIWEIEIKKANGRLPLPDAIWDHTLSVGHRFLAITAEHAVGAARLPRHHGDPFDRMLIAQATTENLSVLTVDRHFPLYDITVV